MSQEENYPTTNTQHLPCYDAISTMDQDNNTRVLHPQFLPGSSNHVFTRILSSFKSGLEVAIAAVSQKVGEVEKFTASDSHNALSTQTMYEKNLARQIIAYLRDHPFSGDTLEGVSRWWVKRQRISECVSEVHQALVRLGNEGLIYERTTADGRTLFFANMHADKFDAVENRNGFEEGEIQ